MDKEAFVFLMNSGKQRLKSNNISGAYSEFKLAQNIRPEDQELSDLMLQTLSMLCEQKNKYCTELDVMMTKTIR